MIKFCTEKQKKNKKKTIFPNQSVFEAFSLISFIFIAVLLIGWLVGWTAYQPFFDHLMLHFDKKIILVMFVLIWFMAYQPLLVI